MAPKSNGQDSAIITNLDGSSEQVTCTFRPKELTMSKQNSWNAKKSKGQNVGSLEFGGGGNAKLQVELLFDTSREGTDVRLETKKLWKMMLIDKQNSKTYNQSTRKGRPPMVQFQWGALHSFQGVIESINQTFVLFKPDGTPVRAILKVSLQQFGDEEYHAQNPTSVGVGGFKVRVVREAETLDLIAFEEYGDPAQWRRLAEANSLDDPLKLRPGQTLSVPPMW